MSKSQPSTRRSRHDTTDAHSPLEIEHRFTVLETIVEDHTDQHDGHHKTHAKHDARMSLLEKVVLVLSMSVYIMAQDKFPAIASLVRGAIP